MSELFLVEYGDGIYWAEHPMVKVGKTTKGAIYEAKLDAVQLRKTPTSDVMMTNIPLKYIRRCPPDIKYSTFELEPVPRYLYNELLARIDALEMKGSTTDEQINALERDLGDVERNALERIGALDRDGKNTLW
jgi:hypothetical protein